MNLILNPTHPHANVDRYGNAYKKRTWCGIVGYIVILIIVFEDERISLGSIIYVDDYLSFDSDLDCFFNI